ncbi:MAG: hypothetical protein ACJ74F_32625 [Mycobacterium sp.]|jgi:hypothetical protein|uniref:hypothetical protein n=1 Tax=Mycobacterium sp. TaxID=1785 RepID=UPI0032019132
MNLREARQVIGSLEADPDAARVFGEVYETADGATVIPVTNVRGASKPGVNDGRFALSAKPAGVFVIKNGKAAWVPAVDAGRIAMMGILVGLVSAALAGVAMVRRPPWPDLHGDISRLHWRATPLRPRR